MKIAIIDYGSGNVGSVKNALNYLGVQSILTSDKNEIKTADKIILPGQGRFGDVMNKLKQKGLDRILIQEIKNGKPYLGICIGLQILFDKSEEDPGVKGLGIINGEVKKFQTNLKVPQIGWNQVEQKKESILFNEINNKDYYFVHSYYVELIHKSVILAQTGYGIEFVSAIEINNLFAVQFHPEKSGKIGLQLLKNFCEVI
jgi:imidazole glycerol-phosphate synthase subunit HisH